MYSFYVEKDNKKVKIIKNKAQEYNTNDACNVSVLFDNSHLVFSWWSKFFDSFIPTIKVWEYSVLSIDIDNHRTKTVYSKNKRILNTFLCSMLWTKERQAKKIPIRKIWKNWKVNKLIKFNWIKGLWINAQNIWFLKLVSDRIYKDIDHNDRRVLRLVDDVNSHIKIKDIDIWDRKVIYNEEHNYLIDLEEDPAKNISGKPYMVLLSLFNNNQKKVLDHIHTEFGFDTDVFDIIEFERINVWDDTSVIFTNKDVKISWTNKDWALYSKVIFKEPILPVGITKTEFDISYKKIMDEKTTFYIVNNLQKKEKITLGIEVDRKWFNKKYMKYNISFRGTDIDLQDFYKAMDIMYETKKLKEFDVVYQNWYLYDKKILVHWWEIVKSLKTKKNYICVAGSYPTIKTRKEKTIKAVHKKFRTIYNKDIIDVSFLWMLGAMCRDIFSVLWQPLPFLLMTGDSRSGKTNLITSLMGIFWFDIQKDARMLNVEWLTPYPIAVAGKDKAPLHLDEFTGNVREWIEATIRGFYDEKTIEKWRLTGVEKMPQLSPLIVSWERMPSWTSVINRWVFMVTREEYKTGDYDTLNWISDVSILDDWWDKIKKLDKDVVFKSIMKFKKWKKIAKYADRVNENYCMIMAINEIFELVDERELFNSCVVLSNIHKKFLNATNETNIVVCELMVANIYNNTIIWTHSDNNLTIWLSTAVYKKREENTRILVEIADKFGVWDTSDITNIILDLTKIKIVWGKSLYNAVMATLKAVRSDWAVKSYLESKWLYRNEREFF